MHHTFRNCCREEMRNLSRAPTTSGTTRKQKDDPQNFELVCEIGSRAMKRQSYKDIEIKSDECLESNFECVEMMQSSL